ncbi:MAG: SRPBCC domain-containing protein [Paracoccaceae bacterium]
MNQQRRPVRASDLELTRLFRAPVAALWRCWTEPALIARWWAPAPILTRDIALDLQAGGALRAKLQTPDGAQDETEYGILAVDPLSRIVLTDLLIAGWQPAASPDIGFTATISMAAQSGGTRYTVELKHADAAACMRHESLGFHESWGIATSQLGALAESLPH